MSEKTDPPGSPLVSPERRRAAADSPERDLSHDSAVDVRSSEVQESILDLGSVMASIAKTVDTSQFIPANWPTPAMTAAMASIAKTVNTSQFVPANWPTPAMTAAMASIAKTVDISQFVPANWPTQALAAAISPFTTSTRAVAQTVNIRSMAGILAAVSSNIAGLNLDRLSATTIALQTVGRGFTEPSIILPGYDRVARQMLSELGLQYSWSAEEELPFTPSSDDTAFAIIQAQVPEAANAMDTAVEQLSTPFLSRRSVRNSLAWLCATLVVVAYIGGAVLPPPWGTIVLTLLGVSGTSAHSAYKAIAPGGNPKPTEPTD